VVDELQCRRMCCDNEVDEKNRMRVKKCLCLLLLLSVAVNDSEVCELLQLLLLLSLLLKEPRGFHGRNKVDTVENGITGAAKRYLMIDFDILDIILDDVICSDSDCSITVALTHTHTHTHTHTYTRAK
jgi:hypothetical protein